jgi:hypothetical protein
MGKFSKECHNVSGTQTPGKLLLPEFIFANFTNKS